VKYVSGEIEETVLPQAGNSSIGIKIPLMKTKGNLIIEEIIIMLAGVSAGGYDDRSILKEAKQNAPRTIPKPKITGLIKLTPINIPTITGNIEIRAPKRNEENTSPRKIVHIETGDEISLSNVLALASHGTIAGPTDVAVKKTVIPSNPGIRSFTGTFRPI